ncbi:MAG: phage tail assembly protein [Candidatus Thiodiazotropha sp. (ex Dulcina madagascariensis)]|nr:phage tail assembly protein [Candidatus Thiodiazotropha sp. (ex Dulcina madagascariensis)]
MNETNDAIELKYPVTVKGMKYSFLTMRRPKVRDQLAAEKAGVTHAEREATLFANLCDVVPDVIKELDMTDYGQLQECYEGFLVLRPVSLNS